MRGHAIANALPVVAVNRVGHEPDPSGATTGILFYGSSFVAGPQGEIIASAPDDREATLRVELDLARTEAVRRLWPFLRDRRVDAYGDIVRRVVD
jgi:N-carbamoylputrescine amidase